jgi:hypothetical protein
MFVYANEILSRIGYRFSSPGTDGAQVDVYTMKLTKAGTNAAVPEVAYSQGPRLIRPTVADFQKQTEVVNDYVDLRGDRGQEIIDQIGGNIGYMTPILPMVPGRMDKTLELLALVQALAAHVAQQAKHLLACRRPHAYSGQLQPMIPTPGHGALPSGHATEAHALAETLARLVPAAKKPKDTDRMLMAQAARIAVNRTVAGLHFPADSYAGMVLGYYVADIVAARAGKGTKSKAGATFDGKDIEKTDFRADLVWGAGGRLDVDNDAGTKKIVKHSTDAMDIDTSQPIKWLWDAALKEWN